jgi:hypothetical protein
MELLLNVWEMCFKWIGSGPKTIYMNTGKNKLNFFILLCFVNNVCDHVPSSKFMKSSIIIVCTNSNANNQEDTRVHCTVKFCKSAIGNFSKDSYLWNAYIYFISFC